MKTLALNVFGIQITWDGKDREGGAITSSMKEPGTKGNHAFNAGVDAIEAMVLAHFCAGMDITEPAYLEGIETAYLALGNNLDDQPEQKAIDILLLKDALKKTGKLNELSLSAVDNMGDIFWDAADHGEQENLPGDVAQKAVEDAILAALDCGVIDKTLEFAIHLEGGLVQEVFCKDAKGLDCSFSVIDYDTEGADDEELTRITQPNGTQAEAYITHHWLSESPAINLDEVFNR